MIKTYVRRLIPLYAILAAGMTAALIVKVMQFWLAGTDIDARKIALIAVLMIVAIPLGLAMMFDLADRAIGRYRETKARPGNKR